MPIDIDSALGIHPQAMILRARRAEVLANNLANADTPNFKARDVDFRSVLRAVQNDGTNLRTTHTQHLQPSGSPAQPEVKFRNPHQASIDGNTVDAQVEYAEFARNSIEYQASLRFLDGRIRSLLTAIRGD